MRAFTGRIVEINNSKVMDQMNSSVAFRNLVLLNREYLRDFADALSSALSKQKPHSNLNILCVSKEAEQHGCFVISVNSSCGHDALNNRCLTYVADMDSRLKARIDCSRMKQHIYCCL
jgi:hypothetical protein